MGKSDSRTSGGVELTDELIDRLAAEAEAGYDVEQLRARRRGRPTMGSEAAVVFQVRLEPRLHEILLRLAEQQGLTPSEVARQALRTYLDHERRSEGAMGEQGSDLDSAVVAHDGRSDAKAIRRHSADDHPDVAAREWLARGLSECRHAAGLSIREIARQTNLAPSTLSMALSGRRFPSWRVVSALIDACGGDQTYWKARWDQAAWVESGRRQPTRGGGGEGGDRGIEARSHQFVRWLQEGSAATTSDDEPSVSEGKNADLLQALPAGLSATTLAKMPTDRAAVALASMPAALAAMTLAAMPTAWAAMMLAAMPAMWTAATLGAMPADRAEEVLSKVSLKLTDGFKRFDEGVASAATRYLCLAIDIHSFAKMEYRQQVAMRRSLADLVADASAAAGLSQERWIRQDRGDGELVLVPTTEPPADLTLQFVRQLAIALGHRKEAGHPRLRVRLALHIGVALAAPNGLVGQSVVATSRLADSYPVREAMEVVPDADLVVIMSGRLFRGQMLSSAVPPAQSFQRVVVREKDFADEAWLTIPGVDVHRIKLNSAVHAGPEVPGAAASAMAPDGTWVATAEADGAVRIWDAMTGTTRAMFASQGRAVSALAIAPDGTWLATGDAGGTVRIWDPVAGTTRATFASQDQAVAALAIAPDGTWLATRDDDRTVRVWDIDGRRLDTPGRKRPPGESADERNILLLDIWQSVLADVPRRRALKLRPGVALDELTKSLGGLTEDMAGQTLVGASEKHGSASQSSLAAEMTHRLVASYVE